MKTPHQFTLIAALLILALAACSQLDRSQQTSLIPQLGHPNTGGQISVAVNQAGQLYTYSQSTWIEAVGGTGPGGYEYIEFFEDLTTSRYNRDGALTWQNPPQPSEEGCIADAYSYFCPSSAPLGIAADSTGNTYTLTYRYSESCDHSSEAYDAWITKSSPSGAYLLSFDVTNATSFALDGLGNIYTVGNNDTGYGDYCDSDVDNDPPYAEIIRKYSVSGSLIWERKLPARIGRPNDVAVSSGNVYVVGANGMGRYSGSGSLVWSQSGGAEEVIVSGSLVVSRVGLWVRAFSNSGMKRWSSFMGGLNSGVAQKIDGDFSNNVYVTGTFARSTTNRAIFVRKLNPSGKSLWTSTLGTLQYDDVTDIATYAGKEIYIVGTTQGRLSPANDVSPGYLYKMNNIGNHAWIR